MEFGGNYEYGGGEMSFSERFGKLTVREALALNEAARQTCAFEATSQVGELGG